MRKLAAFLAEFIDRHGILVLARSTIFFFDFPLDGKAVAIPARHINGIKPCHLLGAHHQVFQNFVERMADVDVAVGIGRAIMQHEFFTALALCAQALEQFHVGPALQQFGLFERQARFHRKVGFWQEYSIAVTVGLLRLVGHGNSFECCGACNRKAAENKERSPYPFISICS